MDLFVWFLEIVEIRRIFCEGLPAADLLRMDGMLGYFRTWDFFIGFVRVIGLKLMLLGKKFIDG